MLCSPPVLIQLDSCVMEENYKMVLNAAVVFAWGHDVCVTIWSI